MNVSICNRKRYRGFPRNDLIYLTLITGNTCTYQQPFVYLKLSDHDSHFPHTSRYSYLESPNFGGNGKYFNDIV